MRKHFSHYVFLLNLVANFAGSSIVAESNIYKQELKRLKKKQDYDIIFDKEAHSVLRDIVQDVENAKELGRFQRFVRSYH